MESRCGEVLLQELMNLQTLLSRIPLTNDDLNQNLSLLAVQIVENCTYLKPKHVSTPHSLTAISSPFSNLMLMSLAVTIQ